MLMGLFRTSAILFLALLMSYGCAYSPEKEGGYADLAYGPHQRQVYDVYRPPGAHKAPVIFMVHGGAWAAGDKSNRRVVKNKIDRWVPKGFVFMSTNYRLLPDANPVQQAQDVAKAIAHAQRNAHQYGADPDRFILMGHSAGAHLVSLLNSDFAMAKDQGARLWLGTVSIDTAALDLEKLMLSDPLWIYPKAFGSDPDFWREASPLRRLTSSSQAAPVLVICSTKRKDKPCLQAQEFKARSEEFGFQVEILPVNLSHTAANVKLGKENTYTAQVEAFIRSLSESVHR